MKYFKISLILLSLIILLTGCAKDDEQNENITNHFKVDDKNFECDHAFLLYESNYTYNIVEEGDTTQMNSEGTKEYKNGFSLLITNADLIQFDDELLLSSDFNHGIYLSVKLGDNDLMNRDDILITSGDYTLNEDSNAITNSTIEVVKTIGGIGYGITNGREILYDINESGSLNIESIEINSETETGKIKFTFEFITSNGQTIDGSYEGSFNILED